jgi:hypothetical protein
MAGAIAAILALLDRGYADFGKLSSHTVGD